ncbi:MAG: Nif3-like dinuclear metal center hexameric protein [Spirochaetia bacterium]
MRVREFENWLQQCLPIAEFRKSDNSLNGLQVGQKDTDICKMSFALDACQSSIEQAHNAGSQALFVHHGLFWGQNTPITDHIYHQIQSLIQYNISLFAVHLPLDAVGEFGNNAIVAKMLGLTNLQSFAQIGVIGDLETPLETHTIAQRIFPANSPLVLNHTKENQRIAIMVGGGSRFAQNAQALGAQCYITGEPLHQIFHFCQENGLSLIAGGHYESEMIGLRSFQDYVCLNFPKLETHLINIPTGL